MAQQGNQLRSHQPAIGRRRRKVRCLVANFHRDRIGDLDRLVGRDVARGVDKDLLVLGLDHLEGEGDGEGQADPDEYYQTKAEAVKVIADGTYPSPPARFENLATKGKPTGLTLAFIQWILGDGQSLLDQAVSYSGMEIKNEDLWRRLDELRAQHEVEWHWVRGHSGHPENERADRLAHQAIAKSKPPLD